MARTSAQAVAFSRYYLILYSLALNRYHKYANFLEKNSDPLTGFSTESYLLTQTARKNTFEAPPF
ncbi:MAG: hypothetical protein ACP5TH_01290 [Fervidicoccaceae archaeon]